MAGGARKTAATRAALTGRLVNHLVTDRDTESLLIDESAPVQ